MQELLDNNNAFMYSTPNKSKSIIAERLTKNIKGLNLQKKRQLMIENLMLVI